VLICLGVLGPLHASDQESFDQPSESVEELDTYSTHTNWNGRVEELETYFNHTNWKEIAGHIDWKEIANWEESRRNEYLDQILKVQMRLSLENRDEGAFLVDGCESSRTPGHDLLKGLVKLNFFAGIPAPSKPLADKMDALVDKELKLFGKLTKHQLMVQTAEGIATDLSGFGGADGTLHYELHDLFSLDRKGLGVVKASLTLSKTVPIKGPHGDRVWIWSHDCFLEGCTDENLEALVQKTFSYLLQRFSKDYSQVNSGKPTFNRHI
jgi:hypothetical protein